MWLGSPDNLSWYIWLSGIVLKGLKNYAATTIITQLSHYFFSVIVASI